MDPIGKNMTSFLYLASSVVDPDPHGTAPINLYWIRIRRNADPDPKEIEQKLK
jgi:hypothetical protein